MVHLLFVVVALGYSERRKPLENGEVLMQSGTSVKGSLLLFTLNKSLFN